MAEMIPLGEGADRLHFSNDEETGNELPAAKLIFAGKICCSVWIEDIQAREFLYFFSVTVAKSHYTDWHDDFF